MKKLTSHVFSEGLVFLLPPHGCRLRAVTFRQRVKLGMDSGHVEWRLASGEAPPSPCQREAGVGVCRGGWAGAAGQMAHLYLLWRLEAQAAPGAHLGLASTSPGWAVSLLGRAGYSPRLLGPTWLGEVCKEGRICQRITSQLPAGHHLGRTELENRAANGCLLYPAGLTSPAHSPGKVSGCQETEHPRGTSCLVPEGPI